MSKRHRTNSVEARRNRQFNRALAEAWYRNLMWFYNHSFSRDVKGLKFSAAGSTGPEDARKITSFY